MSESAGITISGVLESVGTVISTVVTTIAGNPLLACFVGLGLLTAGAYAFRRLMKSAK